MSIQMTIRVDNDLAAFVDAAAKEEESSRAEVINRAIRREVRRRTAVRDAAIYASTTDPELDDDAYTAWSQRASIDAIANLD